MRTISIKKIQFNATHGSILPIEKIRSGLKQVDILSLLLYNITLEKVIRLAEIQADLLSARGPKLLLAYADEIVIIGDSTETVKAIFNKTENATKEVGLKINEEKNKYICIYK